MGGGELKVVMTATGTVRNPDGSTKEIELRAERPMTDDERAQYLAQTIEECGNGNDC
jgi:hypothetical protein